MRKTLFAFLLTISLLAPTAAFAQVVKITPAERKIAEEITAAQMSAWLHFVASDAMGGRDTPSVGLDITAEFLKMNLQQWGFKGAGDNGTFFQKMGLRRDGVNAAETFVTVNGQKFVYGEDLVRVSGNATGASSPKIVYAGNGWMIKSKNLNPSTARVKLAAAAWFPCPPALLKPIFPGLAELIGPMPLAMHATMAPPA
jgi:hypothetical protein